MVAAENCQPGICRGNGSKRDTGVVNANVKGVHLILPGFAENGPTLEIFTYSDNVEKPKPSINQEGFGHIAFSVDDVEASLKKVEDSGGGQLAEVVSKRIDEVGYLTFVYAKDPEGNVVELQKWEMPE